MAMLLDITSPTVHHSVSLYCARSCSRSDRVGEGEAVRATPRRFSSETSPITLCLLDMVGSEFRGYNSSVTTSKGVWTDYCLRATA